jgi:hypothetical protein
MGLMDYVVGANFRDEKDGRVVVFPGDRRGRGYVVKSEAEEARIRSFLKMFFIAQFSILLLGYFLANGWAHDLNYALGRPFLHLYRAMGLAAGIYFVVVGVPYFFLWRSYKKAFLSFTSGQAEVSVSGSAAGQKTRITIALAAMGCVVLIAVGILFLVRAK